MFEMAGCLSARRLEDADVNEPSPQSPRPLPLLRSMIDTVDREVLQLLAQRAMLVREVAQYKREHRVPIRDASRERDILDDRMGRATALGLSADTVESLWRLLMWDSRDRQAALRAEVPVEHEPKTVAIVGGAGGMGSLMGRLFGDLGHHVMIADVNTATTPAEAAAIADVVVISVPIDVTVDVIRDIGPRVREDALLMDVTSVKRSPMETMLAESKASVVGTHPMFGPSVHSMQGQRIVVCPGRGDAWSAWLRSMLAARGLHIKEATPQQHDLAMAVVQVLTHFSTEVMGRTLAKVGVPIAETLSYTSPSYLMELLMTGRHFAQSPDLYGAIEMSNPETARVTGLFQESVEAVRRAVVEQDRAAFRAIFEEVRAFFGDFTESALEQSSFMIDRIVERS